MNMLKYMKIVLILITMEILINSCCASLPEDIESLHNDCLGNSIELTIYCRGVRVVRNLVNNLSKMDKPFVIIRGLEIVPAKDHTTNNTHNRTESANATYTEKVDTDDTLLQRFTSYLRTHELNVKLSDLLADESDRYLSYDLLKQTLQPNNSFKFSEGRRKDKGYGSLMLMGLMFSKMMALMGLGGIGALAMKALGVALMALTMAGLLGLKSMSSHGSEHSTSVQYVPAEGHHKRRRRSNLFAANTPDAYYNLENRLWNWNSQPLAYRGWQKF